MGREQRAFKTVLDEIQNPRTAVKFVWSLGANMHESTLINPSNPAGRCVRVPAIFSVLLRLYGSPKPPFSQSRQAFSYLTMTFLV